MPEPTDKETATSKTRSGYRISNGPVVRFARSDRKLPNDLPEVVELPRVYGAPLLFAIARDPRTLFADWNSVATSDDVKMPPERAAENVDVDVATIPFHLSFQRLIDLFRVSNTDALSEIISRLQKRAVTDEDRALLTPEEWEILRAMN